MTDFRAAYLRGAIQCLSLLGKQDLKDEETWANLLGAIANGVVASVPDTVAFAFLAAEAERKRRERSIKDELAKKLRGV